jgi:hypothetical protein
VRVAVSPRVVLKAGDAVLLLLAMLDSFFLKSCRPLRWSDADEGGGAHAQRRMALPIAETSGNVGFGTRTVFCPIVDGALIQGFSNTDIFVRT